MAGFRVYITISILTVIFFIAGINVGLHGFSLSSSIGSEEAQHLWVKIPGPEGREHPGITVGPPAPSVHIDPPLTPLGTVTLSSIKHVGVEPSPPPHVEVPVPAAVSVRVHTEDHAPVQPQADVSSGTVKDIMDMVESHAGGREVQIRDLITQQQQALAASHHKPISSFLASSNQIPIIILTCNRLELLDATVKNLLAVRGVSSSNVAILQDGALEGVAKIGLKYSLRVKQNTLGLNLRGGAMSDGGSRIATHYKFSLSSAFDELFPSAPAVIIVEDDLLFSPDFYEYFSSLAPVLDADKSLLCISAWNDNGLAGKVRSKYALKRTEFFPGLGWLLTRELYKGELEAKWPTNHWDHWLRSATIHKGRDIIFPEVPRTYHNGIKGTFMNMDTHNKYFRDIDYNTDVAVRWDRPQLDKQLQAAHQTDIDYAPSYILGTKDVYLMTRMQRFDKCNHVASAGELISKLTGVEPSILCIWISANPDNNPEFASISGFFKIWHEYKRGSYHGIHEFYFLNHYVMLINTLIRGDVQNKQPAGVSVLSSRSFNSRDLQQRLAAVPKMEVGVMAVKGTTTGSNCNDICRAEGLSCRANQMSVVNTCGAMEAAFDGCRSGCEVSLGAEQPAYVLDTAPAGSLPGVCLITSAPEKSDCSSSHPHTIRLCPCT